MLLATQSSPACRYVQQDDILPGTSTVWEYLRFHAKLRMGAFSSQGIEQQAWSVIQLLGLSKVGTLNSMLCAECVPQGVRALHAAEQCACCLRASVTTCSSA